MSNSKLRKLCAVLCSGMCALGSASANPGKSDFVSSQKKEYLNGRIQESTEARSEANAYAAGMPFNLGFLYGKHTKSASAIGSLKALKDPKVLEYFEKGDVESLEKIAKSKKSSSIAVYILLRWITSLGIGVGTWFGTGLLIVEPILGKIDYHIRIRNPIHINLNHDLNTNQNINLDLNPVSNQNEGINDALYGIILFGVPTIVAYIASSSVAGGFNVLAQSLLGESKEVQDMGKELLAIMKRAEKNVPKEKSKKRSKSAPVKKNRNNLNLAIDKKANPKPEIKNAKFDKAKLTKQKVANVNVLGKDSNKADNLGRSFGAAPVA